MMRLISLFLTPPEMPPIDIPVAARLLPHAKMAIGKALEFFYYRGAFDGFVVGVLVTLMLQPSIRRRIAKGGKNVVEEI